MLLSPTGCVQLAACRLQDAKKHALYYRLAAAGLVDNEYAAALQDNAAITATRVSSERATPVDRAQIALTGAAHGAASLKLARRALTDAAGHARRARSSQSK